MSTEFKPGTVAKVADPVYGDILAMLIDDGGSHCWHGMTDGHFRCTRANEVADVRPLVVLDLPQRVIPAFIEYLRGIGDQKIAGDRLDLIADQIEAQTHPPKPAEPLGLGAVVEDTEGDRWVRYTAPYCTAPWTDGSTSCEWDDIDAVRTIHAGVTA